MNGIRTLGIFLAVPAALSCAVAVAQSGADSFPAKPVTIVIPFAPGSATETEVRIYGQKMTEYLGQPFVVEFKPGAGATVGTAYVAKAPADGYTLLQVSAAFVISPLLYKSVPYDPFRDFAPVSLMSKKPNVLLVNPTFPSRNFSEYIAYARANPGKVNFATSGAGSSLHLMGAWLHSATNTRVTFIHYKGGSPGVPDLLAGRIDVLPSVLIGALGLMQAGKVRPLAVTSLERTAIAPDALTVAEQEPSMKDFEYSAVIGILAPKNTPAAIVSKLGANFAKAARAPDVVQKMAAGGAIMIGSTPEQYRQSLISESERFRKLIKEIDIKLDE